MAQHAAAEQAWVSIDYADQQVSLEVGDDGQGFELDSPAKGGGFGLPGIAARARELGGELVIDSEPGRGTRVRISLPQEPK